MDELARIAGQTLRHMEEMQADVRAMQAEVKGLQLENRRMLDHLFGKDSDNDPQD